MKPHSPLIRYRNPIFPFSTHASDVADSKFMWSHRVGGAVGAWCVWFVPMCSPFPYYTLSQRIHTRIESIIISLLLGQSNNFPSVRRSCSHNKAILTMYATTCYMHVNLVECIRAPKHTTTIINTIIKSS